VNIRGNNLYEITIQRGVEYVINYQAE
jgi:hypothetical protein